MGARGNNSRDLFLDESDRLAFVGLLAKTVQRCHWTLQAYCLMGHHYHLLVQANLEDLANGMRLLNGGHARTFNRRHRRTGHLFGERYWSEAIERQEHLLECARYIASNPVRAGFCQRAEEWPWGSYRAIAGHDPAPSFLDVEATLVLFGVDVGRAAQRFRAFVADR